jgi:hypothetical protein
VYGEAGIVAKAIGHEQMLQGTTHELSYNAAHLDFCNGLCLDNIQTFSHVCCGVCSFPAVINVTMMKGREGSSKINPGLIPARTRNERRALRNSATKAGNLCGTQLLTQGTFDPKLAIKRAKDVLRKLTQKDPNPGLISKNGKITNLGNGLARAYALQNCVTYLLEPAGVQVGLLSCYCYHSRSKASGGTPFVSANFLICSKKNVDYCRSHINKHSDRLVAFEMLPGGESKETLRDAALAACSSNIPLDAVAELFDIPRDTIIAWRAHETRGTYDNKRSPMYQDSAEKFALRPLKKDDSLAEYSESGWGRLVLSKPKGEING